MACLSILLLFLPWGGAHPETECAAPLKKFRLNLNNFHGLPTGILKNSRLRLEYLKTAGPRIVRLTLPGRPNLLAELPEAAIETPLGTYNFRGGHRLWCAPESLPGTYSPDNDGLREEEIHEGVRLTGKAEPANGIVKVIEIRLSPELAKVTLRHELRNTGFRPVNLAPWTLTMLRLGGTAILPQSIGIVDACGMLPNRNLALWPYTQINDTRLLFDDDFILINAGASLAHAKIGYYNPFGWLAYWLEGVLFRKTFDVNLNATYTDSGCNAEIYVDNNVIELETLGPLGRLEPGKSFFHTETWEFFDSLEQPFIPSNLRERLEKEARFSLKNTEKTVR